ncbi:hypothetical protein FB451DRAFT_1178114 [Mycena latifolia]|nr:hypothetical protein FB451DRAFT_1178114 [Mycena latifolia]
MVGALSGNTDPTGSYGVFGDGERNRRLGVNNAGHGMKFWGENNLGVAFGIALIKDSRGNYCELHAAGALLKGDVVGRDDGRRNMSVWSEFGNHEYKIVSCGGKPLRFFPKKESPLYLGRSNFEVLQKPLWSIIY